MKSQTIHSKWPPMVKAQQNCHLQVTTKILSLKNLDVFFSLLNKKRIVRIKKQKSLQKNIQPRIKINAIFMVLKTQ